MDYTGHLLIDVGLAALTAYARKSHPADLTGADLESAAAYLAALYTQPGAMRDFARGSIFLNAGYTSSSKPERQAAYAQRVLYAWQHDHAGAEPCLFCGKPSAYRASREEIPLLNGRDIYNFNRYGVAVCGVCSLAAQMLPLGCLKSGGGLIAIHSQNPALTLYFARRALARLQTALLIGGDTLPDAPHHKTRIVEWLCEAEMFAPVTAAFFTNNGQNPSIKLYTLETSVTGFLERALHHADASLTAAFHSAVKAAATEDRNPLYEDLLDLPDGARQFLRRYLLRHWGLAALFAERILGMSPERLALLRRLGERFAAYAAHKRAFYFEFARADDYGEWRRAVLRAADDYARSSSSALLITFDEFTDAFMAGEYHDWRLARDLMVLVMLELRVNDLDEEEE